MVFLDSSGATSRILVTNADVYVSGYLYSVSDTYAVYWKNGKRVQLTGPGIAHVYGITVNGTDVYCVGDSLGKLGTVVKAVYWKNGIKPILLPNRNATAYCISVAGTQVYTGGENWTHNFDTAFVWKNEIPYF